MNPYFGVGPISDGSANTDELEGKRKRFEDWITATYRKRCDRGRDLGGYTAAELSLSMHRGEPADTILRDMMRQIHRYFGFPDTNRMAVGLGGGHTGFTVMASHLMDLHDPAQKVYMDTPCPESPQAAGSGFFRQSWAAQVMEMCALSAQGRTEHLHFAPHDGAIPSAGELDQLGIRLFIGVGHETTGATTYRGEDMRALLDWLAGDRENRHAVIDATSLLGAMPWPQEIIDDVMRYCCLFMPLQKAIGGVAGYWVASLTPQARAQIDRNMVRPSFAIPRQQSLAPPADPSRPLTSPRSTQTGPFYDPAQDRMTGGVINTFSLLAFAETTFALREQEARIGPVSALNARSLANRDAVAAWVAQEPLFELVVDDPDRQGAAVTLLSVVDPEHAADHATILARAKQLLGHQGLTLADGTYLPAMNTALYVNAFPGMKGDFRAWIGGVRDTQDITHLLESLKTAWISARATIR